MLISNKTTTTSSSSTTYKNSSPPSHSGPHNYRAERTSAHMLLLKRWSTIWQSQELVINSFQFLCFCAELRFSKMYLNTIQVVGIVPVIYLTVNIISKKLPTVHFHRIISFLSLFPSSKKSDKAALLPRLSLLHPNKIRIFLPPKK